VLSWQKVKQASTKFTFCNTSGLDFDRFGDRMPGGLNF
jgi:hypothetical protein